MLAQQFEIENHRRENKYRLGGWTVTIAVHALILLILFFIYITPPNPPYEDNAGGMTVNYGTSAVGTGDQQQFTTVPVTVQQDAQSNPSPQTSSTSPENLETQNTEDAAAVPTMKNPVKPKDKVNPNALLKPQSKPTANNTPPTPKANPNALLKPGAFGKPNNSKGDGEGHGQGDQGDPNGNPNSTNYRGGGTGTGIDPGPHGSGNVKLAGRHIKAKPKFSYKCNARGIVVMAIKVNKSGKVVSADFSQLGSTSIDDCLIKRAHDLALGYTFDENSTASDIQVGSISFDFKEQ